MANGLDGRFTPAAQERQHPRMDARAWSPGENIGQAMVLGMRSGIFPLRFLLGAADHGGIVASRRRQRSHSASILRTNASSCSSHCCWSIHLIVLAAIVVLPSALRKS